MDILPYVIASAAAGTGNTDLVLTAGVAQDSTDGWPALPGDLCLAFGGTGGAQPTGITTSRGDTLTKALGSSVSPALSAWSAVLGSNGLKAAGPGVTADTIDVAYAATAQAKQWVIIGVDGISGVDTPSQAQAQGTGTSATVTSGAIAAKGEPIFAAVTYQNGASVNWGSNWIPLAVDISSGANANVSVAYRYAASTSAVSPVATLSASVSWNMIVFGTVKQTTLWQQVHPVNGRALVGGSVFKASYPGVTTTDAQARTRFDSIVGRTIAKQALKRYLDEGIYESAANPAQAVVADEQAGMHCTVSVKPRRAVGGGLSSEIPLLRAMLIYWKNNGVAPHVIIGNEATINGQHGPMGDGSTKDWYNASQPTGPGNYPSPFGTAPATGAEMWAANHYRDWFAFYGPTVIKAGIQCLYNPAISTHATSIDGIPDRLDANGRPLCTGISIDYYMTDCSINYPLGPNGGNVSSDPYKTTLTPILNAAAAPRNSAWPRYPCGIGECGFTDGTPRPQNTNPSGVAQWIHDELNVKMVALATTLDTYGRPQLLPQLWFANGTGNVIDTTTDPGIISAVQAWYDGADPSGAGGGTLLVITTAALPNFPIGQPASFSLGATGGTLPYTWSLNTGSPAMPAGLTLSSAGQVTGTPTGSPSAPNVVFKVTDNVGATATVTLTVNVTASFVFASSTLPVATVGVAYSQNLASFVTGGSAPITYSLDASSIAPDGLTVSSSGTLSGTPTPASAGPPGSPPTVYTFQVNAIDNTGATASASFTMSVSALAPIVFPPVQPDYPVTAELYDAQLNPIGPINFSTLSAQLFYNMVGSWQLTMPYDDAIWQQIKANTSIMVINWRNVFEFGGKVEVPGYSNAVPSSGAIGQTTGPGEQLTIAGADYMAMIANRIAFPTPGSAWASQTAAGHTTYTGPLETVIKNLVSDNAGPTAQSGRRITLMDIVASAGHGSTVTRDIAFVQGVDLNLMDIIRSLIGTGGPMGVSLKRNGQRLSFDCFVPRDLTQSVTFSAELGNMTAIALALTDPTCTIAYGQSSVTSSNFTSLSVSSDQWSRTEVFVDQSGQTVAGNVTQAENDALNQGAAQPSLIASFTDIPNMTFGQDYWLGDKVTVDVRPGDTYQDIVSSVNLTVDPNAQPAISVIPQIGYSSDPGALDPSFNSQLLNRVRRLERRLNAQRG